MSASSSQGKDLGYVLALADFKAANNKQLSFSKGDIIKTVKITGKEWDSGELIRSKTFPINGQKLYYPTNFVKKTEFLLESVAIDVNNTDINLLEIKAEAVEQLSNTGTVAEEVITQVMNGKGKELAKVTGEQAIEQLNKAGAVAEEVMTQVMNGEGKELAERTSEQAGAIATVAISRAQAELLQIQEDAKNGFPVTQERVKHLLDMAQNKMEAAGLTEALQATLADAPNNLEDIKELLKHYDYTGKMKEIKQKIKEIDVDETLKDLQAKIQKFEEEKILNKLHTRVLQAVAISDRVTSVEDIMRQRLETTKTIAQQAVLSNMNGALGDLRDLWQEEEKRKRMSSTDDDPYSPKYLIPDFPTLVTNSVAPVILQAQRTFNEMAMYWGLPWTLGSAIALIIDWEKTCNVDLYYWMAVNCVLTTLHFCCRLFFYRRYQHHSERLVKLEEAHAAASTDPNEESKKKKKNKDKYNMASIRDKLQSGRSASLMLQSIAKSEITSFLQVYDPIFFGWGVYGMYIIYIYSCDECAAIMVEYGATCFAISFAVTSIFTLFNMFFKLLQLATTKSKPVRVWVINKAAEIDEKGAGFPVASFLVETLLIPQHAQKGAADAVKYLEMVKLNKQKRKLLTHLRELEARIDVLDKSSARRTQKKIKKAKKKIKKAKKAKQATDSSVEMVDRLIELTQPDLDETVDISLSESSEQECSSESDLN